MFGISYQSNFQYLADSSRTALGNLISVGGLTFYKKYAGASGVNADYSAGSGTGTMTVTRGATTPATYIDSNQLVNVLTTSNVGRFTSGYYDATGYHSYPGIIIEWAVTNLLIRTDGTIWTGWATIDGVSGTPTTDTSGSASSITTIASATTHKVTYTADVGDAAGTIQVVSNQTGAGTVVQNDTVTLSYFARSVSGNAGVSITSTITVKDNGGSTVNTYDSAAITLTSSWRRFSFTQAIADVAADRATGGYTVSAIANGDSVDVEIWGMQLEKKPYSSTFVPTTSASLTRNIEDLKYAISSNRTAASESLFAKFLLVDSNRSAYRETSTTDGDIRFMGLTSGGALICGANDTGGQAASAGTVTAGTSLVEAGVIQHSSPYVRLYKDGSSIATYTVGDFTDNVWVAFFWIGTLQGSTEALNGIISSVAFYNSALNAAQVAIVSNLI